MPSEVVTAVPKKLPRDWRPLLAAALDAGCEVVKRKNGVVVRALDGKGTVMMHFTPGRHNRALENTRSELRRLGIDA